jgi:hypothetical protein
MVTWQWSTLSRELGLRSYSEFSGQSGREFDLCVVGRSDLVREHLIFPSECAVEENLSVVLCGWWNKGSDVGPDTYLGWEIPEIHTGYLWLNQFERRHAEEKCGAERILRWMLGKYIHCELGDGGNCSVVVFNAGLQHCTFRVHCRKRLVKENNSNSYLTHAPWTHDDSNWCA